jgi:hypothetical protein
MTIAATASLAGCAAEEDPSAAGAEDDIRSRAAGKEGETCGNGTFGTPKIACGTGLACEYPPSTAPTGPSGSSSALAGKCVKAGAGEGETCGNGTFGTPKIACGSGLVCAYPQSTAPTGPSGSSSALPGKCAKAGAAKGETCGNGTFGTPKIACADGLVCKYPASTAPTGPSGSSSARTGACATP